MFFTLWDRVYIWRHRPWYIVIIEKKTYDVVKVRLWKLKSGLFGLRMLGFVLFCINSTEFNIQKVIRSLWRSWPAFAGGHSQKQTDQTPGGNLWCFPSSKKITKISPRSFLCVLPHELRLMQLWPCSALRYDLCSATDTTFSGPSELSMAAEQVCAASRATFARVALLNLCGSGFEEEYFINYNSKR